MCEISKSKMIACQLSFYPLGSIDYIEHIEQVIQLIKESKLSFSVGEMSTQLKGPANDVFAVLNRLVQKMDDLGCKFSMTTIISNTCGIDS